MTIETNPHNDNDTNMDARIVRLDVAIEYMSRDLRDIKEGMRAVRRDRVTDFRLLFGSLIAVALGLAALMAKGFGWL